MLNFLTVVWNGFTSLCLALYCNAGMASMTQGYVQQAERHK